ncbi:hypothetical protein KJ742_06695 [Patescibacteria group bacterium]|nr:hypothetical protein [Patescibacteria group bacterium]MBU1683600.1 hypothetical protein [Patescibacteria group bacterium]MBU1934435.1 hypothetical protein [Patescibacteria group bacterium]
MPVQAKTTTKQYIEQVYAAFNKHCEEVHAETVKKLRATAPDDKEARKKILEDQKKELNETLAELKAVLHAKTKETRERMEKIEKQRMEKEFDLEEQLASI